MTDDSLARPGIPAMLPTMDQIDEKAPQMALGGRR